METPYTLKLMIFLLLNMLTKVIKFKMWEGLGAYNPPFLLLERAWWPWGPPYRQREKANYWGPSNNYTNGVPGWGCQYYLLNFLLIILLLLPLTLLPIHLLLLYNLLQIQGSILSCKALLNPSDDSAEGQNITFL